MWNKKKKTMNRTYEVGVTLLKQRKNEVWDKWYKMAKK